MMHLLLNCCLFLLLIKLRMTSASGLHLRVDNCSTHLQLCERGSLCQTFRLQFRSVVIMVNKFDLYNSEQAAGEPHEFFFMIAVCVAGKESVPMST